MERREVSSFVLGGQRAKEEGTLGLTVTAPGDTWSPRGGWDAPSRALEQVSLHRRVDRRCVEISGGSTPLLLLTGTSISLVI